VACNSMPSQWNRQCFRLDGTYNVIQNLLGNGPKEPVVRHPPGVEVDVCLSAPSNWALSYNMRSKCPAQPNTSGFPLTARLVL
jgi:hypothetical protein